jgi:DMSO/TMAO reductase YedYZ molybdopterin-dependent catalytic subunit
MTSASRRHFVSTALRAGVAASVFPTSALAELASRLAPHTSQGTLLGTVPFTGESAAAVGEIQGESHLGRLAFDLGTLTRDTLVTPNDDFFIRTRYPDGLQHAAGSPWPIRIEGLVRQPHTLLADAIDDRATPQGTILLECSGNGRRRAFGLLSAAEWSGVPLAELLPSMEASDAATRVLISGVDRHSNVAERSAGASWVFTFDQLAATGAFLATRMNGAPLPADHGAPVRLIMPGWYGCTMAKWVEEIRFVDDEEPATAQMKEFAARTHQNGVPAMARDYLPASMDQTGMPVRIEQWRVPGGVEYRVIGILWGGDRPTDALRIRFGNDAPAEPVQAYSQRTNRTWTLWSHTWRPSEAGTYRITMLVDDPSIRTRRLDSGFYARTVEIVDV